MDYYTSEADARNAYGDLDESNPVIQGLYCEIPSEYEDEF